jgi:hypothetical protein
VTTPASASPGDAPTPAAVSFVTTEHFTLQGARAATIAESTGRASMFLASVSGGLVALGLVATAADVGTAFYAFALVLLPTTTSGEAVATAARTPSTSTTSQTTASAPTASS